MIPIALLYSFTFLIILAVMTCCSSYVLRMIEHLGII